MNKYVLILLGSVLIASISQIILKKSANKEHSSLIKEYLNIQVIVGYGLLFCSTIMTILALKGLPYKNVPIFETLGYVFILVLSNIFLKEKITKKKLVGNIIIILGIIIFNI
ncbi:MAG: EamA family transporter [Clostridium sp.]|nr:EamA family transporter [Clostridium sp.]